MSIRASGKRIWTTEEWQSFFDRLTGFHGRLSRFTSILSGQPWVKARHIDAFLKPYRRMFTVISGVERVLERQHGTEHGVRRGQCKAGPVPDHLRFDRLQARLTRVEWIALGREAKDIRREVISLAHEFQETKYATKPLVRNFSKVNDDFGGGTFMLDSLACDQHRDWPQFMRVFYGPIEPSTGDEPMGLIVKPDSHDHG